MHSIKTRRFIAAGITAAAVAATGAPSAHAVSKTDKKQNSAIKKVASAGKKINSKANAAKTAAESAASQAAAAKTAAAAADKKGTDAGTANTSLAAKVDAIVATATSSLMQLADGLKTAGSALGAQEYGVVKLQLGGNDLPGAILTSSDIPDDSNGATVSGTLIGSIPAMTAATPVTVRAGIRSAESDGKGDPAFPAGAAGLVSMRLDSPNASLEGGGNTASPPASGFYLPLTSAANAANGGAPVYNVLLTAGRPSTTDSPFGIPTEKTIDLTNPTTLNNPGGAGVAPFTMSNPTANPIPFTVTLTVRFHDLQASASDVTA